MSFPLVGFKSWQRRAKSKEEQQTSSSFWSSEQQLGQASGGRSDDLVVSCVFEKLKEEQSRFSGEQTWKQLEVEEEDEEEESV